MDVETTSRAYWDVVFCIIKVKVIEMNNLK